ncbi:hypothetical protein BJV74DRAFT_46434 [Russula compacta]|nr:hypothetical protein BJV74DRAFT_46434 [Russula compacta]
MLIRGPIETRQTKRLTKNFIYQRQQCTVPTKGRREDVVDRTGNQQWASDGSQEVTHRSTP